MSPRAAIPASTVFRYVNGTLCADDVPLSGIAERVGTPCYVYSGTAIEAACRRVDAALSAVPHLVAYALKANANLNVLRRIASTGVGADIMSEGELRRALAAGFDRRRIVFSGVGKSDADIGAALDVGIRSLHVESEQELDVIEAIARDRGKRAVVALRINPEVDARTHPYIATGLRESKFGLEIETARRMLPRVLGSGHLSLEGIACHIGSMVRSAAPIGDAVEIAARFAAECMAAGAPLRALDAGGGWPIDYGDEDDAADDPTTFGRTVVEAMKRGGAEGLELVIEPGRAIVGDAGVLLTRVSFVKEQHGKRFVIVDAGMTELLRPALYRAYHALVPVTEPPADARETPADVVGPVCESGDFLALARPLPELARGDLLAVRGAGAYAAVMASNYNGRPFAPEVVVCGKDMEVARRRQSIASLWRDEI